jgi:hypothetical protein
MLLLGFLRTCDLQKYHFVDFLWGAGGEEGVRAGGGGEWVKNHESESVDRYFIFDENTCDHSMKDKAFLQG